MLKNYIIRFKKDSIRTKVYIQNHSQMESNNFLNLDIKIDKIGLDNFHKVVHTEKPYLEYKKLITNKNVGSYFMGNGKGFHIYLEKKPNWLHRKCMKLFLGWTWEDNK